MHVLNRDKGGYIVPVDWTSNHIPSKLLNGKGGSMSIYGMNVDFKVDSFADYMKQMASAEKNIASEII